MIPTVILVGLVAGLVLGAPSRFVPLAVVGVAAALGWGLLVADQGAFIGGALVAIPNYIVGVLMGLSIRHVVSVTAHVVRNLHRG